MIVNKLSQEDIDKNISDYNTAVEKENTRHENALAQLKDNYDKESEFFRKALEAVNINKEQYTAQKAELESEINRLEGLMQEAALNNNQQLVSEYALQIAELNDQLSALEKKYSSRVEIDAKLAVIQSKYNDALAIENALYSANMAQIEYDYEFIKKYVKEKEEDDSHQPDNVGDDSGDDSENDGQTPETPSDVN